jgi:hypothetical protein
LLIGHKYGKEIYVIERFVTSDYGRELSHVCGYTHGARLDVGEKMIIFKSVTLQNLVHNSCNAPAGGPPLKNLISQID